MSELMSKLSDDLADVVEAAGPAVVRVEARRRLPASGIVWSSDGLIVTAHHAVEREENIRVGLPDGRSVSATLVGTDLTTDVAVLRTSESGLATPAWAGPDGLRVGHLALALGRPGKTVLATLGIVSALSGGWRTPSGGNLDRYLQTDLVMYPGFSGGPLVDANGQVLGLNTSALLRGIALAVPHATLSRVVTALVSHGRVARPYLGVGSQSVRLPDGVAKELDQESGVLLVSVEADSPADKGGLVLGDTIVALNGQPTRRLEDLLATLSEAGIGSTAPVRIVRGGQIQELTVVVGERG